MIRVGRVIVVTVYAYCVYLPLVRCIVYSVEDDTWLALDKVLVPDIHMILSNGSSKRTFEVSIACKEKIYHYLRF